MGDLSLIALRRLPGRRDVGGADGGVLMFAALLSAGTAMATSVPTGSLTVEVANVRNARGRVHVDLCPEALFLRGGCPYAGDAPAQIGVTTVIVRGLLAGRYAAQAFHDENTNGKVDRALFGIPREGVGFSRDARIRFAPPRWEDAEFVTDGHDQRIGFSLRYFIGPPGPAPR